MAYFIDNCLNTQKTDERKEDRDTDSDDALLLARIGNPSAPSSTATSVDDSSDLEGGNDSSFLFAVVLTLLAASIEELRAEVVRLKQDMRKMATEIRQRDENFEVMMKVVNQEIASMHNTLKEIHEFKRHITSSAPSTPLSNVPLSPSSLPFTVPLLGKDHS